MLDYHVARPRGAVKSIKCPNCGAPLLVPFLCEYCGSRFEQDYEQIDIDFDNLRIMQPDSSADFDVLYADGKIFDVVPRNPALYIASPVLPTKNNKIT